MPRESDTGTGRSSDVDRRSFIKTAGATGAVGLAAFAGCTTTDGGGQGTTATTDMGDGGGETTTGATTTGSAGEMGPITFGQPALLSGDLQFIQPPVSASADLAQQMINDAGGPLGRELNIVRRDTARTPQTGRQVMQQFLQQDDAVVINGFTSTVTVPLWDFFQEQEVPIVTMYAGTRFLDTRGGDGGTPGDLSDDQWYWRTTGADSQHTAAAAVHAANNGASKVAAIHAKTSGSRTWAEAFLDGARVLDGVEVVKRVGVQPGKSSYRSDLASFFSDDIDTFGIAMGVPSATTLMRNWQDGGYGGNVMLSNPLRNPQMVENAASIAEAADGWVRTSVPAIAGPYAQTYRDKLSSFVSESDAYENNLAPNNWSASSYDAVTVSALAVHAAGEATPAEIEKQIGRIARPGGTKVSTFAEGRDALDNGEDIDFVGAQTTVDFNEFGDVFNQANIFELRSGGYTQVDSVSPERIREIIAAQREMNN